MSLTTINYSDVFYRRNGLGNVTALTLQGNASVPALTVTAGNIYANSSYFQVSYANIGNTAISSTGTDGYIQYSSSGSRSAPVLTFSGDVTGLYKSGTGQLAFTSAGTNSAIIANNSYGGSSFNSSLAITGVLTVPNNGGVFGYAPSITGNTDSTTGIFFNYSGYGAPNMGVSVGSTPIATFASSAASGPGSSIYSDLTINGNVSISASKALILSAGPLYANTSLLQANNVLIGNSLTLTSGPVYANTSLLQANNALIGNSLTVTTGPIYANASLLQANNALIGNSLTLTSGPLYANTSLIKANNLTIGNVVTLSNIPAQYALVTTSGGVLANSVTTLTELAQLSGIGGTTVISQLNQKANLSGATFTGAVTLSAILYACSNVQSVSFQNINDPTTGYAFGATGQCNVISAGVTCAVFASQTKGGSSISSDLSVTGNVSISASKALILSAGPIYANTSLVQANNATIGNALTLSAVQASYALVTSASNTITSSTVLATELAQLSGIGATTVISQLNQKANLSSATFTTLSTGTLNVTGTTTLGSSVVLASPTTFTTGTATFTNALTASSNLSVGGDLTVTGNLTVSGNTTTVNTQQLTVADPIVVINSGGLTSNAGLYIGSGTNGANVVVAYNPASKNIEMYKTSSVSTTNNAFTNTGYANLRASALTLDNTTGVGLSLMGGVSSDQGTGIGAFLSTSGGTNTTIMNLTANGSTVAAIYGPDPFTTASGDSGGFYVNGTLGSEDLVIGNVNSSSTVLIRTCDNGAFDAKSNTHNISIQGAILKQNPSFFGPGYNIIGTNVPFNNIMGTLYVSTSNLMSGANAKAGHATISVLKLAGATEMDVMPVSVHQSTLCNVFAVGKSSDNGNVVITTDSDCAITWQFYGSAF